MLPPELVEDEPPPLELLELEKLLLSPALPLEVTPLLELVEDEPSGPVVSVASASPQATTRSNEQTSRWNIA